MIPENLKAPPSHRFEIRQNGHIYFDGEALFELLGLWEVNRCEPAGAKLQSCICVGLHYWRLEMREIDSAASGSEFPSAAYEPSVKKCTEQISLWEDFFDDVSWKGVGVIGWPKKTPRMP